LLGNVILVVLLLRNMGPPYHREANNRLPAAATCMMVLHMSQCVEAQGAQCTSGCKIAVHEPACTLSN
jgi:hypothetical protein